ncbi:MAG: helix-turn-helix domain-containing protein [Chloroflexota bacterium]|nr:helix-turn-helix domain-containing protein [Chloroflexota bacterium]
MNDDEAVLGTPLSQFVIERRERLGMNQTQLSIVAGLSKSEINAIENGRVKLPGASKRRALAKALRVTHLDVLVAAGELSLAEIPESGAPVQPFPEGDPRYKVFEVLPDVPDGDVDTVWFLARHLANRSANAQE